LKNVFSEYIFQENDFSLKHFSTFGSSKKLVTVTASATCNLQQHPATSGGSDGEE
jgi:hypothetical protein